MKITDKRKQTMAKFSDIPSGGVFVCNDGGFYMKTKGIPYHFKNAVRLDDGQSFDWAEETYVEAIEATLVIGNIGDD